MNYFIPSKLNIFIIAVCTIAYFVMFTAGNALSPGMDKIVAWV